MLTFLKLVIVVKILTFVLDTSFCNISQLIEIQTQNSQTFC